MAFSNEDLPNRPVPENDVKKPSMFVLKDWEDYQYNAGLKVKGKKAALQRIRHRKFGEGTVVEKKGEFLIVQFDEVGRKQLNEKMCIEKGLIEFV